MTVRDRTTAPADAAARALLYGLCVSAAACASASREDSADHFAGPAAEHAANESAVHDSVNDSVNDSAEGVSTSERPELPAGWDSLSVLSSPPWCRTPPARNCEFYLSCLEEDHPCGEAGYAASYGDKYCRRFLSEGRLSPPGCTWRDATLSCLQFALVRYLGSSASSCDQLTEAAFESHPQCYTQLGNSICDLPSGDWSIILRVVDGSDYLSRKSLEQIYATGTICLGNWISSLGHADLGEGDGLTEGRPEEDASREADGGARTNRRPRTPEEEDTLRKIELVHALGARLGREPANEWR